MMQALFSYDGKLRLSYKFTGKERDTESGLDMFGARYYGSSMGRFMTPDEPFEDQFAHDPQSWNLYTYVRNNPSSNTDPTGMACVNGRDDDSPGESCAEVEKNNQKAMAHLDKTNSTTVNATPTSWFEDQRDNAGWFANYFLEQTVGNWVDSFYQAATTRNGVVFAVSLVGLVNIFGEGGEAESTIKTVVQSAERSHNAQVTVAERALAKKLGRAAAEGSASAFAGVKKGTASALVRDIMSNPTRIVRGGVTTDVYNAAGQGVRFENGTGRFIGFLEASRATR